MSKFHITKKGDAAACNATVRPCPLNGKHYDSMEDAAMAVLEQEMGQALSDADFTAVALNKDESDSWRDEDGSLWQGSTLIVARSDRSQSRSQAVQEAKEAALYADEDDDTLDDDIADLLAQWDADEDLLTFRDSLDREMHGNPTQEEMDAFQSAEDEAISLVRKAREETMALFQSMPTEWGTEFLERDISAKAADALASYNGLRTLDLLAQDLEEQSRKDFAEGKLTERELEEELQVVGALRFLMNPSEGRRHGPREQRPIDPNLIQALRCLYMKRFGVDPFEQGITVPQLLQMRKTRQI